ncbi:hypothetical protein CCHR01_09549 [Colletotrichum chrysophilum]|uniref:Uncharacterized protein n=1 Tax=Colletotrichum chrysophilum TaxID=1836956 RepID=A0AAD9AJH8_9PEZI|nr:hypothetical protein CCHR01_09549 [Colletotrichum chrysophilum]
MPSRFGPTSPVILPQAPIFGPYHPPTVNSHRSCMVHRAGILTGLLAGSSFYRFISRPEKWRHWEEQAEKFVFGRLSTVEKPNQSTRIPRLTMFMGSMSLGEGAGLASTWGRLRSLPTAGR